MGVSLLLFVSFQSHLSLSLSLENSQDRISICLSIDIDMYPCMYMYVCMNMCVSRVSVQVQDACEFLAREAWRRWIDEEHNVVDDITALIIYL